MGAEAEKKTGSEKRSGRKRRWPWVVGGLIVLLALLVVFLPALLSTPPGRKAVLGRVSRKLNGSVEADAWRLGWFSGVRMQGVQVRDQAGEPVVRVKSARVPASLFQLAGSRKKLGQVEVNEPQVKLVRQEDGQWNLTQLLPEKKKEPLGFDLEADIKVTSGELTIQAGEGEPVVVRGLNVNVKVPTLDEPGLLRGWPLRRERRRVQHHRQGHRHGEPHGPAEGAAGGGRPFG
jgi:uncharacterized protein involved in outer membrane biogenesis